MSAALALTIGLAIALSAGAVFAAVLALQARTLLVSCVAISAMSAMAAAALLAYGAEQGALALALFGVAHAPVFILASLLLSARTAKAAKRGPFLLAGAAGVVVGGVLALVAPELERVSAPIPMPAGAAGLWIAAVLFVAVLSVIALLGYGERGPFSLHEESK